MAGGHLAGGVATVVASGATLLIGASGTLIWFWVQGFFDARKDKLKGVEDYAAALAKETHESIGKLVDAINTLRLTSEQSYSKLKDRVAESDRHMIEKFAEINTRVVVLSANLDQYRQDITKVEGKLEQNTEMGASHIAALGHVTKQLEAIFRIVGAPERPSDKVKASENG